MTYEVPQAIRDKRKKEISEWANNKLVENWQQDISDFVGTYGNTINEFASNWQSQDTLNQYKNDITQRLDKITNDTQYAARFLGYNNAELDDYARLDSMMSKLNEYSTSIDELSEYWGNWDSEDKYKSSATYYNNTYNDSLSDWQEMIDKSKNADDRGGFLGFGADNAHRIINDKDFEVAEVGAEFMGSRPKEYTIYRYLTEDEKKTYNYIYGKEGEDSADKYLEKMEQALNVRAGNAAADSISDLPIALKEIGIIEANTLATLQNHFNGLTSWINDEAYAMPSSTIAAAVLNDRLGDGISADIARTTIDLGNNIVNMLPSMLTSFFLGPAAGAVELGLSSGGNSYNESLREGYSREKAYSYGTVDGLKEALMQYALGGINSLGGKVSQGVIKKIGGTKIASYLDNVSNGTAKALLKFSGSMASEGFEEYLQEVLDPVVRNITLGENNEFGLKNFVSENAIYAGVMGALTAGIFETAGMVQENSNLSEIGKKYNQNYETVKGLIDYASILDQNTEAYRVAQDIKSGTASDHNVGKLVMSIQEYVDETKKLKNSRSAKKQTESAKRLDMTIQGVQALGGTYNNGGNNIAPDNLSKVNSGIENIAENIASSLTESGVDSAQAQTQANIIQRVVNGQNVSAKELRSVVSDRASQKVITERTGIEFSNNSSADRAKVTQYIADKAAQNEATTMPENRMSNDAMQPSIVPKSESSNDTISHTSPEEKTTNDILIETAAARIDNEKKAASNTEHANAADLVDLSRYGKEGQDAINRFVDMYQGKYSAPYFAKTFDAIYQLALMGRPEKQINSFLRDYIAYLPKEVQKAAFLAGKVDGETIKAERAKINENLDNKQEQINNAKKENSVGRAKKGGKVTYNYDKTNITKDIQKAGITTVKALSKLTGLNFELFDSRDGKITTKNGWYNPNTNTLHIDINPSTKSANGGIIEGAISNTVAHEVTHFIKERSPEHFKALQDFIISYYDANAFTEVRIKEITKQYADKGIELSYEAALEELVAKSCETMLNDGSAIKALAQQNKQLWNKIKTWINKFIDKLKATLSGIPDNEETVLLKENGEAFMKKLQELWNNALIDATENYNSVFDANGEEIRYQVRDFSEQIDDVINGTHDVNYDLYISETPNLFVNVGFSDGPLLMRNSKVAELLAKHDEINLAEIKKIPNALLEPLLILKSKTHPTESVVAITDIKTAKGEIIIPVWVNQHGTYLDIDLGEIKNSNTNFVASAYGRNLKSLLEYAMQNNGFLYKNKDIKKVEQLFTQYGLQLPTPFKLSDSDIKISQNDNAVNTQYMQESDKASTTEQKSQEKFSDKSVEDVNKHSIKYTADANGEEIRYQIRDFSEQIDDVIDGAHNPRFDLYVSETPNYLVELKFTNGPLLMRNSKISEILNKHSEITEQIIKQIPKSLENPLLVLKSKTYPQDSVVVITDVNTEKGNMIIPVWINQNGNYVDADFGEKNIYTNFIASSYGRDIKGLLEYANEHNGFLYQDQDINKVKQLLARNGLQLPTPLKLSDSDINLSQNDNAVNTQYMQESDKASTTEQKSQDNNKYSIRYTTDNDPVVVVEEDILKDVPKSDWINTVKRVIKDKFSEGIPVSGKTIKVNAITRNEYTMSEDSKRKSRFEPAVYQDKIKSANNLSEVILASTNYINEDLKHRRKDNFKEFARGDVLISVGKNNYSAKVIIGFTTGQEMVLYDIINFTQRNFNIKKEGTHAVQSLNVKNNGTGVPTLNNTVSINEQSVNTQYMQESERNTTDTAKITDDDQTVLYQLREDSGRSDREVLADALESVAKTEDELDLLKSYKTTIKKLDQYERELRDTNKQIKDISFSKGTRDMQKLAELKERAKFLTEEINKRDKRLFTLERSDALRRVMETERKKVLQKYKDEVALAKKEGRQILSQKLLEQKTVYEARMARDKERRVDTSERRKLREQISARVKKADKLLRHESDTKHIPENLKKPVIDFLNVFTNDSSVFDYRKLDSLRMAYSNLAEGKEYSDNSFSSYFDEDIVTEIENLKSTIDGRRLSELTADELTSVKNIVDHFIYAIKTENEIFVNGKKEAITEYGKKTLSELASTPEKMVSPIVAKIEPVDKFVGMIEYANMTPTYMFKRIGGKMNELYLNVENGQYVYARNIADARLKFTSLAKKYNVKSWLNEKNPLKFVTNNGKHIELTRDQALTIYALSKRDKGLPHLTNGGVVSEKYMDAVKDSKTKKVIAYKLRDNSAAQLSEADLIKITSWLTAEQKSFANEMQQYLAVNMAAMGNEVSMDLYGYEKYGADKNYFPIICSQNYMFTKPGQSIDARLKNQSFTHQTVAGANNPIVIHDFTQIWGDHINRMLLYNAFAVPLDTFNKVYNYKTQIAEAKDVMSVKAALQNAYGQKAGSYVDRLLEDINGGVRGDSSEAWQKSLTNKLKKALTFASASVMIQQPSAIGRAFALVDSRYFAQSAFDQIKQKNVYTELKRYAPVAIIKEMGRFDTGMGANTVDWLRSFDYEGTKDKTKAFFADSTFRDDILSYGAAKADEITWCQIWEAVKRETADKTGLNITSEELLKKAGSRFTEVINKTQVYDSVFSRSELMRSKAGLIQMTTAFMSEPTLSFNMLYDAQMEGRKGGAVGRRYCARVVGAVTFQVLLNSILKSLITAARDDDDDKTYLEKYLGDVVGDVINDLNVLNMIPWVKDVVSIFAGYDVERADLSLITDIINAIKAIDSENVSTWKKQENLIGAIAALFGVPYKNISRDIRSIKNSIVDWMKDFDTSGTGVKYSIIDAIEDNTIFADKIFDINSGTDADKLYNAILDNDAGMIRRYTAVIGEDKVDSAIRKALKDNNKYIAEAALADLEDRFVDYLDACDKIEAQGFVRDMIVDAVSNYQNAIKNAAIALRDGDTAAYDRNIKSLTSSGAKRSEIERIVKGYKVTDTDKTGEEKVDTYQSLYTPSQMVRAIDKGDPELDKIIEDLRKEYTEKEEAKGTPKNKIQGNVESRLKSTITSYFKPLYKQYYKDKNEQGMAEIRNKIFSLKKYKIVYKSDIIPEWIKEIREERLAAQSKK